MRLFLTNFVVKLKPLSKSSIINWYVRKKFVDEINKGCKETPGVVGGPIPVSIPSFKKKSTL